MKRVVLKTVKWTLGSLLGLALAITLSLFIFEDQICSLIVDEMNKNRRIMIVDDEPYNILGLTIILK